MFQSLSSSNGGREHDPLLTGQTKENSSQLVSFCRNEYNLSSEGNTSPFVHARSRMTTEHYHSLDDSKQGFCRRRGLSLMFCFAFISLIFVIVVIFKTQFLSLFGYKNIDNESHLLFRTYEKNWQTLEFVDKKHIPKDWEYHSSCDESHYFDMTFAVSIQNTDKLDSELMKTSMPDSPTYGQHWKPDRIRAFFAPREESIEAIFTWLEYHGITREEVSFVTQGRSYMRVNVNCEQANRMLNTEFGFWKNTGEAALAGRIKTDSQHLRVKDGYSVPESVKEHLDFISPTLRFPMRHHTSKVELITSFGQAETWAKEEISAEVRNSYVTPEKLTSLYHMEDYLDTASSSKNSQAIASFIEEWFSYDDYYLFQTYFDVERTKLSKNPSQQPSGDGDEAELDVQYITSTGRGIDTWAFDVEDDLYFITLVKRILDTGDPPLVVSISYGGDEQSNGWGYCNRASIDLGIATLAGVTFFVSSGDEGAAGVDGCDDYDEFAPSFPATSPYVVAVGGTEGGKVSDDVSDSTDEVAWTDSGGGFSTYFDRMSFQDDAVLAYFEESEASDDLPDSSLYNADGRAYPDISALSVYYIVAIDRLLYSVSGTSCSSPSVAGMFSQINDIRLQNGKSSLGFLNPRLYALYAKGPSYYFNDVVSGHNYGCDDEVGFYADKGWDPVTGVGTPKFSRIAETLIYG